MLITLVVPEGAHHYAIGHGARGYYPIRLRTNQQYPARDEGGPWVIACRSRSIITLSDGLGVMFTKERQMSETWTTP
jgi:hypothetical protein